LKRLFRREPSSADGDGFQEHELAGVVSDAAAGPIPDGLSAALDGQLVEFLAEVNEVFFGRVDHGGHRFAGRSAEKYPSSYGNL
jgi:hypothetical protein